jgi:hypothetical protein
MGLRAKKPVSRAGVLDWAGLAGLGGLGCRHRRGDGGNLISSTATQLQIKKTACYVAQPMYSSLC